MAQDVNRHFDMNNFHNTYSLRSSSHQRKKSWLLNPMNFDQLIRYISIRLQMQMQNVSAKNRSDGRGSVFQTVSDIFVLTTGHNNFITHLLTHT